MKVFVLNKRGHSFKAEAFKCIMRWTCCNHVWTTLSELVVKNALGYLTSAKCIALGLSHTHYADAFCSSVGISDKKLRLLQKRESILTKIRKEAALPSLSFDRGFRAEIL